MKKLLSLSIMVLLTLTIVPAVFAVNIGSGVGVDIVTEDYAPNVWMCGARHVFDDATEPGRISYDGQVMWERTNNYAFEGEQIMWKVLVKDKNGVEKIRDVFATIGDSQGAGNEIEVNCQRSDWGDRKGIKDCNARILEEELTEFDAETMDAYVCTLTVETPESMYGEYWITVEAEDLDGLSGVADENEYWFLNPEIALSIEGVLAFENVRQGSASYSNTLLVGNDADDGSGVLLDMFISGTDFYDTASSGAMCPTSNRLKLSRSLRSQGLGADTLIGATQTTTCNAGNDEGAMWITVPGTDRIARISYDGTITEFDMGTDEDPETIIVGLDGNLWFTNQHELSTSDPDRIHSITQDGVISSYDIPSSATNIEPDGIVVGLDGAMWFTTSASDQIGRITSAGVATIEYNLTSGSNPEKIAVGPDGRLWFAMSGINKIGALDISDPSSLVLSEYSIPTAGSSTEAIIAGPDGAMWFTEEVGNKIGRMTIDGVVTDEFTVPTSGGYPDHLVLGSDGRIWFTEHFGDKIGAITAMPGPGFGDIEEYPTATSGGRPDGIAVGPRGGIWFTEEHAGKVVRMAYDGTITDVYTLSGGGSIASSCDTPAGNPCPEELVAVTSGGLSSYDNSDHLCYFATSGSYSTLDSPNADLEGYVPIVYGNSFTGNFYNDAEILWNVAALSMGYSPGNVLTPGSEMAITFKLGLPEPCNGDFDTGQIYFWGEAI